MGLFSFFRKDPAEECAQRVALQAGLLAECPVCRDIVDNRAGSDSWQKAEKLAADSAGGDCGDAGSLLQGIRTLVKNADINCSCDNDSP